MFDITGIKIIPGNNGADCPGNGEHFDEKGNHIECCCDECDYMMCCFNNYHQEMCKTCTDNKCPKAANN